jgi:recombinational DNA repair ATPase RecF
VIDQIEMRNFRSLRYVKVPLKPLTVLIGANDTGKSSFIDATAIALSEKREFTGDDFWRWELDEPIEVILTSHPHGAFRVTKSRGRVDVDLTLGAAHVKARAQMAPAAKFRLPAGGLQLTCKGLAGA